MNKISNIYPKIIAKENLYCSAYMAARGRRYRDAVADFNFRLEDEIDKLHKELVAKTYRHGRYRLFSIYEPKERNIAAAPFRDRVIHHAVHDIIEPMIDKTFIYHSYACRKGKGTHKAVDKAQSFLRANRFCFHGDIKKYFHSINHGLLKDLLRVKIGDKDVLWLLDEIVDSAKQLAVSDSRFLERGLPIGNLTSQFFANLYLNELDYFVKFDLRAKYYLRYTDDFLIFGNDKKGLCRVKAKVRNFLKDRLRLALQEGKSQVYKTANGIKFLGFRIFKDYRRLASDNVRRFRKHLKRFEYLFKNGKIGTDKIRDSVRCWVAHSKYANTRMLRFGIWQMANSKLHGISHLLKDILSDGVGLFSERERERNFAFRFLNVIFGVIGAVGQRFLRPRLSQVVY